jgi:cobalt-zinc-cadmium efflux system membrane fusion protein
MTAIVTRVHVTSGAAVRPGQLLFELRLTHEDLVNSQTAFLKTLGELAVERKELQRVQGIAEGAIAGKLLLERQYAVQKLESELDAEREALKLHGLNDDQVRAIEEQRKLLRTIEIFAPAPGGRGPSEFRLTTTLPVLYDPAAPATPPAAPLLVLEDLRVHQGQALTAGETLCILAEYSHLYIEGQAFEKDAPAIIAARAAGWPVAAQFEGTSSDARVEGLPMAYVANAIDVESRTLHFYVDLPNELLPQPRGETGSEFITWKYRPGQRLELLVPVEEWPNEIVLPVDAVAREGAESFVFLQNGKHFDRKPVHVKYRDQSSAVIAHDGSLFPGDVVALRGAHQLLMALKNKSGGGVDPHAGHTH